MSDRDAIAELIKQYGQWGEHPTYSLRDWQHEVANDYTRRGYWDWVASKVESNS